MVDAGCWCVLIGSAVCCLCLRFAANCVGVCLLWFRVGFSLMCLFT